MLVNVSIFGIDGATFKNKPMKIKDGSTAKDLIEKLGIDDEKVSFVTHNKRQVIKEHIIEDNSEVYIVGIVAGG